MYKVFEVDDCFEEYAMSVFLVGAENEDDLIEHLPEIIKMSRGTKKLAKKIIKAKDWRIKEVEHLFTDTPYVNLYGNAYIE